MALPKNLRAFDDTDTARQWLMEDTLGALKQRFPIEDDEYKLELSNPRFTAQKPYGLTRQKQALLKDEQLRTPVKGTWRLTHKPSGQVLDEREDTVMHLPYLTNRGTLIYGGNEYSTVNQSRLKAGVYTRHKKSGEVEAFYNVKPGTGRTFRVWLEPETGVFKVNIGQSNIPLFPLMQAMGVDQKTLVRTWGPEIVEANMRARAAQATDKLYQRFTGLEPSEELSEVARRQAVAETLAKAEIDPDVVARTLGISASGITPEVLLRSTQKLLNVSRGDEDADDRDAPKFSRVLAMEDFIRERIENDAGRTARTMLWKARRDRSLKRIHPGALNPYVQGYMFGSRLTMPLEETNPLSLLEQSGRIVKLGDGGISDAESITDEARDVNIGQLGFVDPITGPEGTNIGIDVRAAHNTFKGRDGQMYAEFTDAKTGELTYLRPEDLDGKTLAFPGELDKNQPTVMAAKGGRIEAVPRNEVDFVVPSFAHMMSANTNLNPMPTGVQPARQFYGSKFWSQYMPQVQGEVPLVDSVMDTGETFSEHYGKRVGAVTAPQGGTVTRVTKAGLHVTYADGTKDNIELVQDFPFNRITGISYSTKLQAGMAFDKGDMIAHSNFVDPKTGGLLLGRNLRTAVMPYRGHSYEDAYVISEDAARNMTTQRLYGFDQDSRHGIEINRNKFASLFPERFSKEQLGNMNTDGVIKPGSTLQSGDPIILATGPNLLTPEDVQLGRLHKALRHAQTDKATVWDHEYPGVVTDAVMTRHGAKVNVKAQVPVRVGDKLSTRFGLKGVVGTILPADKMPRDAATNQPYDLLLNPMGILSRVAPNQLVELQLGKLARRTGKQQRIPQLPPEEGWTAWALQQLEDAGIPEKETVFDPELGRTLSNPVATGDTYVLPFHHLSEKKLSERGSTGVGYTLDELPARGGKATQGAKKMSSMDITQLLAHGATDVIKDAQVIRGARNEEFWKALKLGRPLPEPRVPFVYDKFLNMLKAGGVNIRQKGDILELMPMMDADIAQLSHGAINSSKMLNDELEPLAGGLFDPGRTGGAVGKFWSHIELNEPMPNPVFEEPIRRLLGLKVQELRDVIAGRKTIGDQTGGEAIKAALGAIDINDEIEKQSANINRYTGANRDSAVKILGYLTALKRQGTHPSSWMMTKVPVLPPVFRPVSKLGDITIEADLNELYRDLIEVNNAIGTLRADVPDEALAEEKVTMYDAMTAVMGLGEPITPEGRSRRLKGAIRTVIGDSPKRGFFQSRVMAKPVDVVGRGVVTPDPNLDMDSIGIPEESAWGLYKDFVLRRLVRQNIPVHSALEMIEDRSDAAKQVLESEMQQRPVIVDRAPTWHKFNLMAFHPHMVEGDTVRVSPLVTTGFTMDFDGDAVNFHVPTTDKAVNQALGKMLPSRNLFSLTDLKSVRHAPQQEMSLGLYMLTRKPTAKDPVRFKTAAAAKKAYKRGEIGPNDPIVIGAG